MPTRIIHTKKQLEGLMAVLGNRKLPLTVTYQNGKHRSTEQNKLQRLWLNEIAEQLGDRTPEEIRGECKLRMGVPILRAENEDFRATYDKIIKPLPYEQKQALMMDPISIPVTSIMTMSQKVRYLDHMQRFYLEMGLELTEPDPQFQRDLERYNERASA